MRIQIQTILLESIFGRMGVNANNVQMVHRIFETPYLPFYQRSSNAVSKNDLILPIGGHRRSES